MQYRLTQLGQAVEGARGYIRKYADTLPRTSGSGARTRLDALGNRLRAEAAVQNAKGKDLSGQVERKDSLRRGLYREHLAPIVAAARALESEVPDLASIRLPKVGIGIPRLAAEARGMADALAPFADQFIGIGLEPDFLVQLRAAIDCLEASMHTVRGHRGARVNATTSLKAAGQSAVTVLRLLDRMIRAELGENEPALAEWVSLRRTFTARTPAPVKVAPDAAIEEVAA
jgi:hypothetical protein